VNNTKRRRILSITHEQDVDGLFCDAILKNAFPDTLVFLTNYGYENMGRAADIIKSNVGRSSISGTIVFSDLTVNSDVDVEPIESCYSIKESWMDFGLVRPSQLA
jgi:oligoribonuclease NrnB/cAMP/cGMP phosphodiesterase (DHH superfamily)